MEPTLLTDLRRFAKSQAYSHRLRLSVEDASRLVHDIDTELAAVVEKALKTEDGVIITHLFQRCYRWSAHKTPQLMSVTPYGRGGVKGLYSTREAAQEVPVEKS